MSFLKEDTVVAFDLDNVKKGDFIRAKYHTWPEFRNGIVSRISVKKLDVFFLPGPTSVSNYFFIDAREVFDKKWTVQWSSNLMEIHSFP